MIAAVRGRVRHVDGGALIVSVGPVDLRVLVPAPTAREAAPGSEIALHTHLYVREDQLTLYGFSSEAGLETFELLLSVSGVGPKGALGLLSALSPAEVRGAIAASDARALARAPGIGQRAAARIITDLQGKISAVAAEAIEIRGSPASAAIEALVNMGYSLPEARRAVDSSGADGSVEDVLRAALAALAER